VSAPAAAESRTPEPLLRIDGLYVTFGTRSNRRDVVRNVDLRIERGEVVGLVGESGSGKSLTALAIMQLLPGGAHASSGRIMFDGIDLLRLGWRAMNERRGRDIAMIFQDPLTALNPTIPVGRQIYDCIRTMTSSARGPPVRASRNCWRWLGFRIRTSGRAPIRMS
jgi:ABC-type microcin C transport system duplicated ATPase subunit YejF